MSDMKPKAPTYLAVLTIELGTTEGETFRVTYHEVIEWTKHMTNRTVILECMIRLVMDKIRKDRNVEFVDDGIVLFFSLEPNEIAPPTAKATEPSRMSGVRS